MAICLLVRRLLGFESVLLHGELFHVELRLRHALGKPLDRFGRPPQLGLGDFERLLGEADSHVVRRLCAGDVVLRLGRIGRQPRNLVVDLRQQLALLHALAFAHRHARDDARLLRRHLGLFDQPQHDRFDFNRRASWRLCRRRCMSNH